MSRAPVRAPSPSRSRPVAGRALRAVAPRALLLASLVAAPGGPAEAAPQAAPTRGAVERSGPKWFARGMELHEERRWDEAIDAFRKAIEKGYREDVATFNVACAFARKGERDRAFEWLEKAMAAGFDVHGHLDDSDLEELHADPRWAALQTKARQERAGRDQAKVKRAAERFELLVARTPRDGRALFDVGRDLLRYADYDRATRAFVAAAEAGVREGTSLYNAACAQALANRRPEALDLLQRALDAGFDDPEHLRDDDDLDGLRAEPRFRQILKDADDLTLSGFPSLGARLLRSQMVAEAEEAATRIEGYLKRRPSSGHGWFNLGRVSLSAEDDPKAARAFRKALDLGYRRGTTSYNLACAHARMKQKDEAFAWLDRAIEAGYASWRHMEDDDDLWSLRRDPRFERAVEKAKRAAGRAGAED